MRLSGGIPPPPEPHPEARATWIDLVLALLIAAATLAVYWQVRGHDFVPFDDPQYVSANEHVKAGLTPNSIRWAFTTAGSAHATGGWTANHRWHNFQMGDDMTKRRFGPILVCVALTFAWGTANAQVRTR